MLTPFKKGYFIAHVIICIHISYRPIISDKWMIFWLFEHESVLFTMQEKEPLA